MDSSGCLNFCCPRRDVPAERLYPSGRPCGLSGLIVNETCCLSTSLTDDLKGLSWASQAGGRVETSRQGVSTMRYGFVAYPTSCYHFLVMDHYDILDVSPEATPEQIKAAYRILVQLFHPDRLQHVNA